MLDFIVASKYQHPISQPVYTHRHGLLDSVFTHCVTNKIVKSLLILHNRYFPAWQAVCWLPRSGLGPISAPPPSPSKAGKA